MQDFAIKGSPIAGKGIFANRDFHAGDRLFRLEGPTIQYNFEPDYRNGPDWLQIGPRRWKIAKHGNIWVFMNHSCESNSGMRRRTEVVAMRSIRRGEEVTIDYSMIEGQRRWHMRCGCNTASCRGVIRSAQFLSPKLFERYRAFMPAYLRKVYLSEKAYVPKPMQHCGVFAKHQLKRGERIFRLEGPVVKYSFPPDYRVGNQWLATGINTWMVALRSNPWWSIRHSCEPNVGVRNGGVVVAMRTIQPNEELLVDDSATEADPRWKRRCACGAKTCRKLVQSVQYLSPELFERYRPFMSTFIKDSYRAAQNASYKSRKTLTGSRRDAR